MDYHSDYINKTGPDRSARKMPLRIYFLINDVDLHSLHWPDNVDRDSIMEIRLRSPEEIRAHYDGHGNDLSKLTVLIALRLCVTGTIVLPTGVFNAPTLPRVGRHGALTRKSRQSWKTRATFPFVSLYIFF